VLMMQGIYTFQIMITRASGKLIRQELLPRLPVSAGLSGATRPTAPHVERD